MIALIEKHRTELTALCHHHRVKTLDVFGSAVDGTFDPACSDLDCEIVPPNSVTATVGGTTLITDALIGSVQAGETFNFFVELTAGGPFTQLGGTIGSACTGAPGFSVAGPDLCRWDAPAGQTRFGVAVQAVAGRCAADGSVDGASSHNRRWLPSPSGRWRHIVWCQIV